jgi:hydroxymethylpyrimidine pyrophosphatase-like HAD family hydrolase
LAWLAQHFDISQSEVLAAGDQGNDLAMVEWAGIGVAMGNAVTAVKAVATWTAPPVTDDGAVAILERFVLKEAVA